MHPFTNLLLFASAALAIPLLPRAATVTGNGLAFYTSNLNDGSPIKAGSTYTCYSGSADSFPPMSQWASFNALWAFQVKNALSPIGDTNQEIQAMQQAVVTVGQAAQVDPRVILAVILQESSGNVNVGCTNNGVSNCGIMQSHDPIDKAFDPSNVQDGVQGTPTGPGLVQLFNNQGAATNGNLWEVLRAYNSGSIDASNLSNGLGATASYVSDIANYLQGWQGWGSSSRNSCGFA
ncbi:hypothetical protein MMC10_001272 [Thelotrema lepadinum]|nr:hypothetical protein [Thelotrema lepadinum]